MSQLSDAADYLYEEYREGRFPMAEDIHSPVMIVTPHERALLPIKTLHISRSLRKSVQQQRFDIRIDTDFAGVIAACAESTPGRPDTWISPEIEILFQELHRQGRAHSIECWQGKELVGGLYGLEVGGVFCGESMFSRRTDASKIALVHLCARLFSGGFLLLDAQFHNPHLEQFGLEVIPQEDYVTRLHLLRDARTNFALAHEPGNENELVMSYLQQNKAASAKLQP